ncbi:4581_t:CDS:1, partial [Funneliformis caledonium]
NSAVYSNTINDQSASKKIGNIINIVNDQNKSAEDPRPPKLLLLKIGQNLSQSNHHVKAPPKVYHLLPNYYTSISMLFSHPEVQIIIT